MGIDVPLVRDQLKRAEMIKAARIYKQGRLGASNIVNTCKHVGTVVLACVSKQGMLFSHCCCWFSLPITRFRPGFTKGN